MFPNDMKLVTVDQMRRIEAASDAQGHSYAAMMERAGRAVARVIQTRLDVRGQRILVLVGPGNNGGDGLVAARHLHDAGAKVGVFVLKPRDDADANTAALRERAVNLTLWTDDSLPEWLDSCAVIVDALLGTGTARPIKGVGGMDTLERRAPGARWPMSSRRSARAPPRVAACKAWAAVRCISRTARAMMSGIEVM